MDFELKTLNSKGPQGGRADAVIMPVPEGWQAGGDAVSGLAAQAHGHGDLPTKPGKVLQMYRPEGPGPRRMVFVGAGQGTAREVRQAVAAALSAIKSPDMRVLALHLGGLKDVGEAVVRATMLAVSDVSYTYTATKSRPQPRALRAVEVWVPDPTALRKGVARAAALVGGMELAREWANRPGNHATPRMLAKAAKDLAGSNGISCEVLDEKAIRRLGMGSFLAVAQGSAQPPRFIILKYKGAAASQAPVVLVGKGITFDTGGISIKPAPEMDEMKFDMGGAASVLGVFAALAKARPAVNVVGLIPTCENMPDGLAVKPGDVVTSMSGQTIEILNTDAEGRLILCDALTYASRFKPAAVVDIATLTGACVIALGAVRSGLFSPDDALAGALAAAGESALDPCWRMPLDDDYAEGLKTNFADVANVAGRAGGSVTAAKFLQRFATGYPWAHLDIAGTAWKSGAAKGATGRPVALLFEYLCSLEAQPSVKAQPRRSAGRAR